MKQYLDALAHILDHGEEVTDRTGVGTKSVFGYQMRFNLNDGFPAVTTKKLAWRSVVGELLWFLEGSTDERRLAEITFEKPREELIGKKTIWTANADKQGKDLGYVNTDIRKELGPVYGFQWRNFGSSNWVRDSYPAGRDQIKWILNEIKNNPDSRRIILSAWEPNQIDLMALPPCHTMAQFRVINGKLSCQMYQRSVDAPLGLPFNIASYSLLTHMLAQICELDVGDFIHTSGDLHIYQNQLNGIDEQLKRTPYPLSTLKIPDFSNLTELLKTVPSQYKLVNYQHDPEIKMPFAV